MDNKILLEETLTRSVIGAFFEVFNALNFGFLEATYMTALQHELRLRGHCVEREVPVQIFYKGTVAGQHRLDMVVDRSLVVEAKSSTLLAPTAQRQLYSYLHATRYKVGLLLHFGPEPKFYRLVCTRELA
ncbi:MAG: GxxExxY protein [Gemmatimonadaceae bacterium]